MSGQPSGLRTQALNIGGTRENGKTMFARAGTTLGTKAPKHEKHQITIKNSVVSTPQMLGQPSALEHRNLEHCKTEKHNLGIHPGVGTTLGTKAETCGTKKETSRKRPTDVLHGRALDTKAEK